MTGIPPPPHSGNSGWYVGCACAGCLAARVRAQEKEKKK